MNIRRLNFFEARDACFGESDSRLTPLVGGSGVTRYEVSRISNARTHKGQLDLWRNSIAMINRTIAGCVVMNQCVHGGCACFD